MRVLLAATVAGNAGTQPAGGIGATSGGAATGGTGGSGGLASTGTGGSYWPPSAYCGDGYRDGTKEECDEGSGSPGRFCNWACQVQDNWASRTEGTLSNGARAERDLGRGRHPIAAGGNQFAVALVERVTPGEQQIRIVRHDNRGLPLGDTVVSTDTWVADDSNPVVAVLANGDVVAAYTEFGGDGDGLGVALRRIRAGQTQSDIARFASEPAFAAQYDADILALPDRLLVAYTDEYDVGTGPDITLREFGLDLQPRSTTALAATTDVEGRVALAAFGSGWGAAWRRATAEGLEYIDLYDSNSAVRWSVGPHVAGNPDDVPALVGLDATRRMVVYSRIAADGVRRLHYSILSTTQPATPVASGVVPTTSASFQSSPMGSPALTNAGGEAYLSWSSVQRDADPFYAYGEDVWVQRITPNLTNSPPTVAFHNELPLPRWSSERVGDQRFPAVALLEASAYHPGAALVAAWVDYGETLGAGSAEPEVVTQVAPLGLRRDALAAAGACSIAAPCTAGSARCFANNECASPLVCSVKNGVNFDFGTDVGVCVAAHCADNVLNNGEVLVDCGGPDCGTCPCGDGTTSTALGEVCDTAGDSATCDRDCTAPVCGDGLVNVLAGEQCDLGAGNGPAASCLANCTLPPTCVNGASCFSVQSQRVTSSSNEIKVYVNLVNNSSVAQSLSGVTLRYWFTGDGASAYSFACDYSPSIPCSAITGVASNFTPIRVGADRLMSISVNSTSVINPGQSTGTIQLRIIKQDSTATNQTNDYSLSTTTMAPNTQFAMYRNGSRIWGNEPSATYACGNAITEPGEVCDNAANTRCRSDCQGFNVVNGTACTNPAQCLSVEHYSNDSASDNMVRPFLRIVNRSGVPVALNRIAVKYWFTTESTSATPVSVCASGINNSCPSTVVTASRISPTYAKADAVMVTTTTLASILGTTDMTNTFQVTARRSDWGAMNESTSDWSRTGATTLTTAPKVALYVDGQLWWGEEPK